MRFVDQVRIQVKAGGGGRGCVSFRREKFVPKGGPNGGDGGDGGDVVVVTDAGLTTLLDLRYQRLYRAGRGEHGKGKDQHGRKGEDRTIAVPVGTIIRDAETGDPLADLTRAGERVVVARGGKGGKGNAHFASSTNRSPRHSQPGLPGEEKTLDIELRLLADVGIIGLPNVGKSTLIAAISSARPKIADYPFTTLVPNLGVVEWAEGKSYVVADIPGLVEGAHRGGGLGHQFLRHVARTSLLVHLTDGTRFVGDEPLADWRVVNRELELFSPDLKLKTQLVVINKLDLPAARDNLQALATALRAEGVSFCAISAVTGEGVAALKRTIGARLEEARRSSDGERVAVGP
jgi:GTP-binding protein